MADHIDADLYSALGPHPVVVIDATSRPARDVPLQAVVIGCDRAGTLPRADPLDFDVLLTTARDARLPWVFVDAARFDAHVDDLVTAVRTAPIAATLLCQTLRLGEMLPFDDALTVESLAYSALLGGSEFARWRAARGAGGAAAAPSDPVRFDRAGDLVTLTLDSPGDRNAMTATLRDALYGALANLLDDPSRPRVSLRGAGKCFSTGGALGEFGCATDLAAAHVARTLHSCARAIHALGDRIDVQFHGACVGSGVEVPMAAARRTAAANAWFQLPELRMGLIPGAGGTVTLPRAIGRHRTAWMVLSGARLPAAQACDWGLVHAVAAP